MNTHSICLPMLVLLLISLLHCYSFSFETATSEQITIQKVSYIDSVPEKWVHVDKPVLIENYFTYIDSLVNQYTPLINYQLSEHIIVRANPSIITTLANTDYYRMMAKDSFVYNQRKMVILKPNDSILIPNALLSKKIVDTFEKTLIDINIPEFKLRIYEGDSLIYTFPIRVGKNTEKYLAMNDKLTSLQTKTGTGTIVRHVRNPDFYNPVDDRRYYYTKRDDGKTTLMPQIPWIETELNGERYGQMIHPTTNPNTLEKAYSNGCIGVKEADAWIIYYYAPIGTKIQIRYDLNIKGDKGQPIKLEDIYQKDKQTKE
ncbi:L,D-transpeptidase [Mangrovimonas aestuarii]|uniref:L,D-transpeptidase n=1 Tax=Mangrovimonas aestuarii TaxID=3018443 RepID=UPI0023788559|nr:L,D-transpeptidase [Mangrovimonas aestuarii]